MKRYKKVLAYCILIVSTLLIYSCWNDECGQCPAGHECYYGMCLQSISYCPSSDPNIETKTIKEDDGTNKVINICRQGYYCACRDENCDELYCAPLSENN